MRLVSIVAVLVGSVAVSTATSVRGPIQVSIGETQVSAPLNMMVKLCMNSKCSKIKRSHLGVNKWNVIDKARGVEIFYSESRNEGQVRHAKYEPEWYGPMIKVYKSWSWAWYDVIWNTTKYLIEKLIVVGSYKKGQTPEIKENITRFRNEMNLFPAKVKDHYAVRSLKKAMRPSDRVWRIRTQN